MSEDGPIDGRKVILEFPDPYGLRRRENETPEEQRIRLNRTISNVETTIETLTPVVNRAEERMLEYAKGVLKLREERDALNSGAGEVPNISELSERRNIVDRLARLRKLSERLATQERIAGSAQASYEVLDNRLKKNQEKLIAVTVAFDALPDTEEPSK